MPKKADESVLRNLDRVLAPGGYWFIKLNPFYSLKDLKRFDYQKWGIICMRKTGFSGFIRKQRNTGKGYWPLMAAWNAIWSSGIRGRRD